MEEKYTFKQALVLALVGIIPSVLAAIAANIASDKANRAKVEAEKIYNNQQIRQARMDERDLILASVKDKGAVTLIPVENDNAWRLYLKCRDDGISREICSNKNRESILKSLTSTTVGSAIR